MKAQQTMRKPNLMDFTAFMKADGMKLIKAYNDAKAFAKAERERVNAYTDPIFARYKFPTRQDFPGRDKYGEFIKNQEQLYLCTDDALCQKYYNECDTAHREHGFTGPDGHSPALIAEHDSIKAENALLDGFFKMFGMGAKDMYGKHREKALELILSLKK